MEQDDKIINQIFSISKEVGSIEEYLDKARQLKKDLTFYDDEDAEREIQMIWQISAEEDGRCHI